MRSMRAALSKLDEKQVHRKQDKRLLECTNVVPTMDPMMIKSELPSRSP